MSADVWFEPRVPDTDALSVAELDEAASKAAVEHAAQRRAEFLERWYAEPTEDEHQAALRQIDLPPSPLDPCPVPAWWVDPQIDWRAIGAWWLGVAQLGLGVVLGYLLMLLLLVLLR